MKKEVEKIYKKLTKSTVFEIAEEARIQLMFESGKNSDEQKKTARTKSMARLAAMLIYEKKKNQPDIEEMAERTLLSAYNLFN
jgi:hypothetical protein